MRKIFLALSVIAVVIIGSSTAFAYDENEAREAMIAYSGTEAFTKLLPEERRACMLWVSDGGKMSETCRSAVTRLISEEPDAVTPAQRKALLSAAAGINVQPSAKTTAKTPTPPPSNNDTVIKNDDNTGAIIVAGIVGLIAGMIIHNNWPRHSSRPSYIPAPYHHRPYPPDFRPGPPRRHQPVMRQPAPMRRTPPPLPRNNTVRKIRTRH